MKPRIYPSLLFALCLVSCGATERSCDGYGCQYDLSSADGVRFRNNPPATAYDQGRMESMIAMPYREVEKCVQVLTGGPLVVSVANDALGGFAGMSFSDGVIVVTDNTAQDGWDYNPATGVPPYSALRHEYVHYLLDVAQFSREDNHCHRSALFLACSGHSGIVC